MKVTNKKSSFVRGAIVLMIFGILSKILGAIYRIPLTSIITPEGMGLYQMVFPVYALMLTVSSSGLPSSISKLISESLAKKEYRQVDRIMKVSFLLLFVFSIFCSLILVFGARGFATLQGNKDATICYLGLAPAIVFVGLLSGFRGYFQGFEKMLPSAISGFVEQFFKLVFGLFFAWLFMKKGVSYAVLGAMLGISLSEVFALFYMFVTYVVYRKKHKENSDNQSYDLLSTRQTAKKILSTSIFITLGGLIMPLGMLVDSALIINILKNVGFSTKMATTLFGLETGTVGSIVNMPVVLSLSLATAILPCVCSKKSQNDLEGAKKAVSKALFLAIMIALPASLGCYALANPIIKILYGHSLSAENIKIATNILEVASISIFYLAMVQVSAGVLQGISLVYVPAISLSVGMILKIVLNVVLVRIPSVNILGAEVANSFCYFVALLINLIVIKKQGFLQFSFKIFGILILSSLTLGAKYIYKFFINASLNFYLAFTMSVLIVVVVYLLFVFLFYKKELKEKV